MPGTIAFLATGFASYFGSLIPLSAIESRAAAIALISIFTIINYHGLKPGILVQNTFTCLKLAGIVILIAVAFLSRAPSHLNFSLSSPSAVLRKDDRGPFLPVFQVAACQRSR
jgi:amino acid transporter